MDAFIGEETAIHPPTHPCPSTVTLSIPLKGKKNKGQSKEILHQVSGLAPAGQVTAIMGPTGKKAGVGGWVGGWYTWKCLCQTLLERERGNYSHTFIHPPTHLLKTQVRASPRC